jgi:hypothetical protein
MSMQLSFLDQPEQSDKYTMAPGAPLYQPKHRRPNLIELCDVTKTHKLLRDIDASTVSIEEKQFLMQAARRHLVFNYELIADYYAHASPEMQRLMEDSALVIVDFNRAIELGYVKLCADIERLYLEQRAED